MHTTTWQHTSKRYFLFHRYHQRQFSHLFGVKRSRGAILEKGRQGSKREAGQSKTAHQDDLSNCSAYSVSLKGTTGKQLATLDIGSMVWEGIWKNVYLCVCAGMYSSHGVGNAMWVDKVRVDRFLRWPANHSNHYSLVQLLLWWTPVSTGHYWNTPMDCFHPIVGGCCVQTIRLLAHYRWCYGRVLLYHHIIPNTTSLGYRSMCVWMTMFRTETGPCPLQKQEMDASTFVEEARVIFAP